MGALSHADDLRGIIPGWLCFQLKGRMTQYIEQAGESGDESASFHCAIDKLCDLGQILDFPQLWIPLPIK